MLSPLCSFWPHVHGTCPASGCSMLEATLEKRLDAFAVEPGTWGSAAHGRTDARTHGRTRPGTAIPTSDFFFQQIPRAEPRAPPGLHAQNVDPRKKSSRYLQLLQIFWIPAQAFTNTCPGHKTRTFSAEVLQVICPIPNILPINPCTPFLSTGVLWVAMGFLRVGKVKLSETPCFF